MSKASSVKLWRRKTKDRIIESMGGECSICGYNKCSAALELHHIDPSSKEFSFGSVRANPKSWSKIVKELRKCILVCSNCHKEIHAGATIIPDNCSRFNENFQTYQSLSTESEKEPCPICGQLKPKFKITCSRTCAAKKRSKVKWEELDLDDMLKTKSYTQLAKELGVSDNSVRKQYKKQIAR